MRTVNTHEVEVSGRVDDHGLFAVQSQHGAFHTASETYERFYHPMYLQRKTAAVDRRIHNRSPSARIISSGHLVSLGHTSASTQGCETAHSILVWGTH